MVTRNEDSVWIRYFDKKSVEESLREYLKEIEGKHPEVERAGKR
jgi:hypothetical protein